MDEPESIVKIETEPDIEELVAPVKRRRKQDIALVVCSICAKEVKYLYQHIKDVHMETHTFAYEENTSGFGTKPPEEIEGKLISVSYNGGEPEIASLSKHPKQEENINSIKEEVIELEFAETYSKDDNKNEEKEELNKMDELEGLVQPQTEPDIDELVVPVKKVRKQNKIPVVAKACTICAKEVKHLNQHIKDVHTETLETDPDGLVTVKKRRNRKRNKILVVAKVCLICAKEVKYLKGHIEDVHTETPHENIVCDECGKVFSKRKKLKGHFQAVHKLKPSMCDICSQVFKNDHALRGHKRKVHEEISEVTCPTCFKVCETEQKLYYHERAVHTIEDAKCQACGKTYKNKNLMLKHQKVYHRELFDGP